MMGFRHVAHEHDLSFYRESEKEFKRTTCNGCDEVIHGPAYHCDTCERFILHDSCFGLPKMVNSPLHPHHPLILLVETTNWFICNGCRNLHFKSFVYNCLECEFNLDVDCAFPNKEGNSKRSSGNQSENLITEIEHFLDIHKLHLFYHGKQDMRCKACSLQLGSDACYGCFKCYLFLHKSCLEIPKAIQHYYHPHKLCASMSSMDTCCACEKYGIRLLYRCAIDGFNLHLLCAKNSMERTPPLSHKCHQNHDLYCFVPHDSIGSICRCHHCGKFCNSAFYRCFECDFSVHLECIPIPQKVEYPEHCHPLILKDSFCEDNSGVYYCYDCGKPRNPNFPVYWCEECPEEAPYVAHVECILSEEDDFRRSSWQTSHPEAIDEGLQVEPVEEEESEEEEDSELWNYWHEHLLFLIAKEGMEIIRCNICEKEIEGGMYICEICSDVHFHPSCAALPGNIKSPLHIHSLYVHAPDGFDFICGLCKTAIVGYHYKCDQCAFALEVKCAFLSDDECQDWKEKHPEVKIKHFRHRHELTLIKYPSVRSSCNLCGFPASGFTYWCLDCGFFIHESCSEMPQQIQPSYHQPHQLIAQDLGGFNKYCGVCGSIIFESGYSCKECRFYVHFTCGTRLTSPLKLEFHPHSLYSFSRSDLLRIWNSSFQCYKCSDQFYDSKKKKFYDSFYRCMECNLNVHLECIPLPNVVKHSDHCDPLTLMSSMREDDSGVYYCDICQQPRNPNHPVYWCEECLFAAHVGCVIQEGDASLEVISWEEIPKPIFFGSLVDTEDSEPFFGSLFDIEEAEIVDEQTTQEL